MSERKTAVEIDAEVNDLISKKINAEDGDSGWAVAYAMMRMAAVIGKVEKHLDKISWVLGDDITSASGGYSSPRIAEQLRALANIFEERKSKEGRDE